MSDSSFPPGYVRFDDVRTSMPEPRRVQVSESVELETIHVSGSEPTIVFVHGGLGSLWNPYPQLDAFEDEQELVTYALAGNGNSTTRPEQSLAGHVVDLENLLDELGISRPIIHGHSYGTAIALEYAKHHSVSGLALHAGGAHGLTPAWEKPFLQLFLALRLYRLPVDEAVIRQLANRVGFHRETSPAVVEDFLQANPFPRRRSAWTTVTQAFWGYDGRRDTDRVDVPALVVHGPADGIVPLDVARVTAQELPNGTFCRLERTGHMGMIERPRTYSNLLRALLDAVGGGPDLETAVRRRVAESER